MLRPLGYRSYHSGKWHVDGMPLAGGFDRSYYLEDVGRYFHPRVHYVDDRKQPPGRAAARDTTRRPPSPTMASAFLPNMRRNIGPSRFSCISHSMRPISRFRHERTTSTDTEAATEPAGRSFGQNERNASATWASSARASRMWSAASARHMTSRMRSNCSVRMRSTVPCPGIL